MLILDFLAARGFLIECAFLRNRETTGTSTFKIDLSRLCTNITRSWIVASVRLSNKKLLDCSGHRHASENL